VDHALECLNKIKQEIESKKFQEADMWCHFGTAIIREPSEGEYLEGLGTSHFMGMRNRFS